MIEVKLKRTVPLYCYDIIIDMGVKTNSRPDIISVTKLALEYGGKITAKQICTDLINRPKAIAVGENILSRCKDLGLFLDDGLLTDEGEQAAKEETVFIPETGMYRAWFSTDPLISQKLVSIEAIQDGPLYYDVYPNNDSKRNQDDVTDIPEWVEELIGEEIQTLGDGSSVIKIYSMEPKVRIQKNQNVRLDISLRIPQFDNPALVVSTANWSDTLDLSGFHSSVMFDDIWDDLLGNRSQDWTGTYLKCSYDDLSDSERSRFRTDITLKNPTIEGFGAFNDVVVREIPIAPRLMKDCEKWANFTLRKGIRDYLWPDAYDELVKRTIEHDEFSEFTSSLSLPPQQELSTQLANESGDKPKEFWYIQAPLDLSMQEESDV